MKQTKVLPLLLLLLALVFILPSTIASASNAATDKAGLERPTLSKMDTLETSDLFTPKRSASYSSEWEKYGSYYYYNQMNHTQKAFYDRLNSLCITYTESTEDAKMSYYNYQPLYHTAFCSASGLSKNDAYYVAMIFYYSNPQYYFLSPGFYISYSGNTPYIAIRIYDAFADGNDRKKATSAVKSKINSYVTTINKETSLVAKEKKAHDIITNSVIYQANTYDQSAYSTLIKGETVCAGYSAAFAILCNAVGIDTAVVTSYDHAWNYIRLNDSWYYVDCTWDDTDSYHGDNSIYTFFNRSQDKFLDVSGSDFGHHIEESLWNGYIPTCTLDSGATMTNVGKIHTPSKHATTPVISIAKKNGYNTITMTGDSSNTLIYYTTDGTTPSAAKGKAIKYHSSFSVSSSSTIKAIAVNNTYYDSAVSTQNQVVTLYSAFLPTFSAQPTSATYAYKTSAKPLTVKARVSDGGKLSYQWYESKTASTSKGTPIKNATSASYTPSTSSLGIKYYYCIVKNTNTKASTTKTVSKTTSIAKIVTTKRAMKKASIAKISTQAYSDKSIKPSPAVKWGSHTLKKGTDYTISYSNNKAIGKATITFTGKGIYTGSKKVTFTIAPKAVRVRSVSAKTKAFKINWNKVSKADGYTIQYSAKKNFSGSRSVTVKKGSSTSATISKLKAKRGYYVRIRSYKVVNKKTYCSNWSKAYSVKTK